MLPPVIRLTPPPPVAVAGKTSPVVLPWAASAAPGNDQSIPRVRVKFLRVSTIRASIITCGSGMSRFSITAMTVSMLVGSSLMISVLVRASTITVPRWLSTPPWPWSRPATVAALA